MHVATTENRLSPGMEASDDLKAFLTALKHGGYTGRISVECLHKGDLKTEALAAIDYLRSTWESIK